MNGNFLVFEYVAPNSDANEAADVVMKRKCAALLKAADAVLDRLSEDTRQSLNRPVSYDLLARLSDNGFVTAMSNTRARCALIVEEAALAVQGLVLGFNIQPRVATLDSRQGIFIVGGRRIPVGLILARLRHEAGVPGNVVKEVWQSILAVLLEGKISVPGLRVKSPLDP